MQSISAISTIAMIVKDLFDELMFTPFLKAVLWFDYTLTGNREQGTGNGKQETRKAGVFDKIDYDEKQKGLGKD
jgi:hypothetical protein